MVTDAGTYDLEISEDCRRARHRLQLPLAYLYAVLHRLEVQHVRREVVEATRAEHDEQFRMRVNARWDNPIM